MGLSLGIQGRAGQAVVFVSSSYGGCTQGVHSDAKPLVDQTAVGNISARNPGKNRLQRLSMKLSTNSMKNVRLRKCLGSLNN